VARRASLAPGVRQYGEIRLRLRKGILALAR
jgi:hypothetical protein